MKEVCKRVILKHSRPFLKCFSRSGWSESARQWPASKQFIQMTCSCRYIIAVVLIASSLNEFTEVVSG